MMKTLLILIRTFIKNNHFTDLYFILQKVLYFKQMFLSLPTTRFLQHINWFLILNVYSNNIMNSVIVESRMSFLISSEVEHFRQSNCFGFS